MSQPAKLQAGDSFGFLQALGGFSVAALVSFGVGGSLYKVISPEGWIGAVFGRSVAGGIAALLALLMIGVSVWLMRAWIPAAKRRFYSEFFVYVFAGLGSVYTVELLMKGVS